MGDYFPQVQAGLRGPRRSGFSRSCDGAPDGGDEAIDSPAWITWIGLPAVSGAAASLRPESRRSKRRSLDDDGAAAESQPPQSLGPTSLAHSPSAPAFSQSLQLPGKKADGELQGLVNRSKPASGFDGVVRAAKGVEPVKDHLGHLSSHQPPPKAKAREQISRPREKQERRWVFSLSEADEAQRRTTPRARASSASLEREQAFVRALTEDDYVCGRPRALSALEASGKVEQMRESFELQAVTASNAAGAIPDVADELAAIAFVDRATVAKPLSLAMGRFALLAPVPARAAPPLVYTHKRVLPPAADVKPSSPDSVKSFPAPASSLSFDSEERAQLVIFVRSIQDTPDAKPAAAAKMLDTHKRCLKRLALVSDPRLAAAVRAYEAT